MSSAETDYREVLCRNRLSWGPLQKLTIVRSSAETDYLGVLCRHRLSWCPLQTPTIVMSSAETDYREVLCRHRLSWCPLQTPTILVSYADTDYLDVLCRHRLSWCPLQKLTIVRSSADTDFPDVLCRNRISWGPLQKPTILISSAETDYLEVLCRNRLSQRRWRVTQTRIWNSEPNVPILWSWQLVPRVLQGQAASISWPSMSINFTVEMTDIRPLKWQLSVLALNGGLWLPVPAKRDRRCRGNLLGVLNGPCRDFRGHCCPRTCDVITNPCRYVSEGVDVSLVRPCLCCFWGSVSWWMFAAERFRTSCVTMKVCLMTLQWHHTVTFNLLP
jgi:hypothetical protein